MCNLSDGKCKTRRIEKKTERERGGSWRESEETRKWGGDALRKLIIRFPLLPFFYFFFIFACTHLTIDVNGVIGYNNVSGRGGREKIEGRHFSALLYYVTNTELAAIKGGSHTEKLTVIYMIIIIIMCAAAQCYNNEKPLDDATPSCKPPRRANLSRDCDSLCIVIITATTSTCIHRTRVTRSISVVRTRLSVYHIYYVHARITRGYLNDTNDTRAAYVVATAGRFGTYRCSSSHIELGAPCPFRGRKGAAFT